MVPDYVILNGRKVELGRHLTTLISELKTKIYRKSEDIAFEQRGGRNPDLEEFKRFYHHQKQLIDLFEKALEVVTSNPAYERTSSRISRYTCETVYEELSRCFNEEFQQPSESGQSGDSVSSSWNTQGLIELGLIRKHE